MIEQAVQRREVVRQEVARDLQLALLTLADELTGLAERIGSLDVAELANISDFVGRASTTSTRSCTRYERPTLHSLRASTVSPAGCRPHSRRSVLQAARRPPAATSAPTSTEHFVTVVVATGSRQMSAHARSAHNTAQ